MRLIASFCLALGAWLASSSATARDCGPVEIKLIRQVYSAESGVHRFMELRVSNRFCRPIGLAPYISPSGKYWFTSDRFVRWESRKANVDQWIGLVGFDPRVRPTNDPLVMIPVGASVTVYVQLVYGVDSDFAEGPYRRIYLTDASGVSRSSREFKMEEFPPVKLVQLDVGSVRK